MCPRLQAPAHRGLVVWVNGAFGVGKTSVAAQLARSLPARCYDPELAGIALQRITPRRRRVDDFQNLRIWRAITVHMVTFVSRRSTVVVPMTLVDADVRAEVFGGLADRGVDVAEFWLHASESTIVGRLAGRGDDHAAWPHSQIERCLQFGASNVDLALIDAEHSIGDVTDQIIGALAGLGTGSVDR